MIGKVIGAAVCFTAMMTQAGAQEFGIELNGGLQGMHYTLKNGQTKGLPAGSLGLNYTFRLGSQLGLLTGITGGLYRTQATLEDGQVFTYGEIDDAGSAFLYRLKFTGYKETQHFFAASIPLLLQYHSAGAGNQWYFDGGVKLFLPFNASSQVSAQQVSLAGYYPDFNVQLSNLPQHGFGTMNSWNSSATSKGKPAAALSAGTGILFRLSPGMSLYTGVFVDFGLTDLKGNNDTLPIVTYSSNGINGSQANGVLNTANAGRATLLSYGLQVRLTFGSPRVARSNTIRSSPSAVAPALSYDEVVITLGPVIFGNFGETSIPEIEKPHLDEVANLLKRHPNIRLSFIGHYCDSETGTENRNVGEARAEAVAQYLQDRGIPRNRMKVGAAGKNDTVGHGAGNSSYYSRRVVIAVE